MKTKAIVQADVDVAIERALANGYDEILSWSSYELALDLACYDSIFSSYVDREAELVPFIDDYKFRNKEQQKT